MRIRTAVVLAAALLSAAAAGCIVHGRGGGHGYAHVGHVHSHFCTLYVDLYDCPHEHLVYLESCGIAYADMGLYIFLGYHSHWGVSIYDLHRWRTELHLGWVDCFDRVGVSFDVLYVDLPASVHLGPPYGHAYGFRGKRGAEIRLADSDVHSLWQFRVMTGYYGYSAHEVAALGRMDAGKFHSQTISIHAERARGKEARESPGKPIRYEERGPAGGRKEAAPGAKEPPVKERTGREPADGDRPAREPKAEDRPRNEPKAEDRPPKEPKAEDRPKDEPKAKEPGPPESSDRGKKDAPEKGKKGRPGGGGKKGKP